ncbi:MAG: PHP domain-containing protein [Anaerolineae bacterium]|nr:PHP domain-containing protein [Anaerolineae bacterium]
MDPLIAQLPFTLPGQFYKGNLHTHSTNSDGGLIPREVCAFYQRNGYHFLSITDHFMEQYGWPVTDTRPFEAPGFVTIPGAELHTGRTSVGEIWHILANGLPFDFAQPVPHETGPQLARRALDAGAFVTCAHPSWYALSEADVLSLGPVHAIETMNGISADHNDRIDSWAMFESMLAQGHRYTALTTDDAHFLGRHDDHGRAWTWVKSTSLTPEALLAALKRGEFYSSSGPEIFSVEFSNTSVYVRCSPVESVFVTGKGAKSSYAHGRGLFEAELPRSRLGDSPYCRVTIRDARGGRAWTNAVWF